ncbi:hypothetical protein TEA_003646 [Camellia sinensis var. sinensis]|uniref:Uncharacterized protein n=1 Tax=Camellia sinensis var. sinensis TaxID=542762 RepID=A0A4S4E446_CAMSN|nr:hypothetical protein TEA_003646 [Camellia sinensis var. sinensis]
MYPENPLQNQLHHHLKHLNKLHYNLLHSLRRSNLHNLHHNILPLLPNTFIQFLVPSPIFSERLRFRSSVLSTAIYNLKKTNRILQNLLQLWDLSQNDILVISILISKLSLSFDFEDQGIAYAEIKALREGRKQVAEWVMTMVQGFAAKKGIMVFALHEELDLTELVGDFKVHIQITKETFNELNRFSSITEHPRSNTSQQIQQQHSTLKSITAAALKQNRMTDQTSSISSNSKTASNLANYTTSPAAKNYQQLDTQQLRSQKLPTAATQTS